MDIYEEGFIEFIEEGLFAEKRKHYRTAASNYYKATTELCNHLIFKRTGKIPSNHSEIFLFLKINFPEIHAILEPAFDVYTRAYDSTIEQEELNVIKNVIKQIVSTKTVSENIRNSAEKI